MTEVPTIQNPDQSLSAADQVQDQPAQVSDAPNTTVTNPSSESDQHFVGTPPPKAPNPVETPQKSYAERLADGESSNQLQSVTLLRFDASDKAVFEFLKRLGLKDQDIGDGEMTREECERAGLNFDILMMLSKIVPAEGAATTDGVLNMLRAMEQTENVEQSGNRRTFFNQLSAADVAKISSHPKFSQIKELLLQNKWETKDIVSNLLGINNRRAEIGAADSSYADYANFDIDDLRSVHFSDAQVPPIISQAGQSVLSVKDTIRDAKGSAVVVDSQGTMVSAYHVFFDPEGNLRRDYVILPGGQIVFVTRSMFSIIDSKKDFVQFTLPQAAGLKPLSFIDPKLAQGPFWCIGYPFNIMRNDVRHYTVGRMATEQAEPDRLVFSAGAWGGYSGGAIVDSAGNLVALTSNIQLNVDSGQDLEVNADLIGVNVQATVGIRPPPVSNDH